MKGLILLYLCYEFYFLHFIGDLLVQDSVKCLELKLAKCVFDKFDETFFYNFNFFLMLFVGILFFLKFGIDD